MKGALLLWSAMIIGAVVLVAYYAFPAAAVIWLISGVTGIMALFLATGGTRLFNKGKRDRR